MKEINVGRLKVAGTNAGGKLCTSQRVLDE
jgi:hypothetical protein